MAKETPKIITWGHLFSKQFGLNAKFCTRKKHLEIYMQKPHPIQLKFTTTLGPINYLA
jgi:hypothetical protein